MTPDEAVRSAYADLRGRRWEACLATLADVRFDDRPGAQGRIHAFRAQALEALGRLDEGEREAAEAVRCAKRAGEEAGLGAVRALHQRILQAIVARRTVEMERRSDQALLELSDAELVAREEDDARRAAALVRRAGALCDAGRPAEATQSIHLALSHARAAGSPREEVLALLCALRASPPSAEALLLDALAVAHRADDHNLLTAVARAATAAGVRLPAPTF